MSSINRDEYIIKLTNHLQSLRKMINCTQAQLADRLDISRQRLIGYERGDRNMPWTVFLAIVFLFASNEETRLLLEALGILTDELDEFLKNG